MRTETVLISNRSRERQSTGVVRETDREKCPPYSFTRGVGFREWVHKKICENRQLSQFRANTYVRIDRRLRNEYNILQQSVQYCVFTLYYSRSECARSAKLSETYVDRCRGCLPNIPRVFRFSRKKKNCF